MADTRSSQLLDDLASFYVSKASFDFTPPGSPAKVTPPTSDSDEVGPSNTVAPADGIVENADDVKAQQEFTNLVKANINTTTTRRAKAHPHSSRKQSTLAATGGGGVERRSKRTGPISSKRLAGSSSVAVTDGLSTQRKSRNLDGRSTHSSRGGRSVPLGKDKAPHGSDSIKKASIKKEESALERLKQRSRSASIRRPSSKAQATVIPSSKSSAEDPKSRHRSSEQKLNQIDESCHHEHNQQSDGKDREVVSSRHSHSRQRRSDRHRSELKRDSADMTAKEIPLKGEESENQIATADSHRHSSNERERRSHSRERRRKRRSKSVDMDVISDSVSPKDILSDDLLEMNLSRRGNSRSRRTQRRTAVVEESTHDDKNSLNNPDATLLNDLQEDCSKPQTKERSLLRSKSSERRKTPARSKSDDGLNEMNISRRKHSRDSKRRPRRKTEDNDKMMHDAAMITEMNMSITDEDVKSIREVLGSAPGPTLKTSMPPAESPGLRKSHSAGNVGEESIDAHRDLLHTRSTHLPPTLSNETFKKPASSGSLNKKEQKDHPSRRRHTRRAENQPLSGHDHPILKKDSSTSKDHSHDLDDVNAMNDTDKSSAIVAEKQNLPINDTTNALHEPRSNTEKAPLDTDGKHKTSILKGLLNRNQSKKKTKEDDPQIVVSTEEMKPETNVTDDKKPSHGTKGVSALKKLLKGSTKGAAEAENSEKKGSRWGGIKTGIDFTSKLKKATLEKIIPKSHSKEDTEIELQEEGTLPNKEEAKCLEGNASIGDFQNSQLSHKMMMSVGSFALEDIEGLEDYHNSLNKVSIESESPIISSEDVVKENRDLFAILENADKKTNCSVDKNAQGAGPAIDRRATLKGLTKPSIRFNYDTANEALPIRTQSNSTSDVIEECDEKCESEEELQASATNMDGLDRGLKTGDGSEASDITIEDESTGPPSPTKFVQLSFNQKVPSNDLSIHIHGFEETPSMTKRGVTSPQIFRMNMIAKDFNGLDNSLLVENSDSSPSIDEIRDIKGVDTDDGMLRAQRERQHQLNEEFEQLQNHLLLSKVRMDASRKAVKQLQAEIRTHRKIYEEAEERRQAIRNTLGAENIFIQFV